MTVTDSSITSSQPTPLRQWLVAAGIWLALWFVVFFNALYSAAGVWWINEAFNHCFFVLPAVLYALWQQRGAILQQPPGFSWLGLLAVLAAIFVYALGLAAHVEVLQHLAVFGLIPLTALMVFGWRVIFTVWAPLLFVLFSVPLGEELVPVFQEVTADIALGLLKYIGIPVYRDGLYITIPNGSFVVAEACSGIRFFIACVVIGCAYAYLNFIAWWRSLVFIAYSILLPVIANGFRAFGIIYVGHATNMKHAVGADHLVYGWLFFALVIVILVMTGYFFSDGSRPWQNKVTHVDSRWQLHWALPSAMLAALPLVLAGAINITLTQVDREYFRLKNSGLTAVNESVAQDLNWTPRFSHASEYRILRNFRLGTHVYQAVYWQNDAGEELVSWQNRVFDIDRWSVKESYRHDVAGLAPVNIHYLTSLGGTKRLLAYWYVVPNRISSAQWQIKLQQAFNSLLMQPAGGAVVAISVEFEGKVQQALTDLQQLLDENAVKLSARDLGVASSE